MPGFERLKLSDPHAAGGTPPELYREPRWYACRTRARAEKKVDERLAGLDIQPYLPLVEREREWADRRKRVGMPLFPGYVFGRFDLTRLGAVLRIPGLVTVVRLNDYPAPVSDAEIESVRRLVDGVNATGAIPQPVEYLEVGQRVRVTDGPFAGMIGELLEVRGGARVLVRLTAIRQAVSIELTRDILKAAAA